MDWMKEEEEEEEKGCVVQWLVNASGWVGKMQEANEESGSLPIEWLFSHPTVQVIS